jgi:hypothetical protein
LIRWTDRQTAAQHTRPRRKLVLRPVTYLATVRTPQAEVGPSQRCHVLIGAYRLIHSQPATETRIDASAVVSVSVSVREEDLMQVQYRTITYERTCRASTIHYPLCHSARVSNALMISPAHPVCVLSFIHSFIAWFYLEPRMNF